MCTAINYSTKNHYFGRNLDLEYNYHEEVVITPRNYPFHFKIMGTTEEHYAMIGMATVSDQYPLYYEATNEKGLSMAGLSFPGNAHYPPIDRSKNNVAPFELIPLVLSKCKDMKEACELLQTTQIANIPFSDVYPTSPLHWIMAYMNQTIVIEQTKEGMSLYENPFGILTNNPPFPYHMVHLQNYMHLSPRDQVNRFSENSAHFPYSHGMGAIGLPGDLSSASRFVRATFMKENAVATDDENSSVSQFFHMLNSVAMPRGSVIVDNKCEITVYSCCCNTNKGIYYYTTYDNSQINAVHMFKENLDHSNLYRYPLIKCNEFSSVN